MIRYALISVTLFLTLAAPVASQNTPPWYDFRARTRELAFDPGRFFADRLEPAMSIRYLGDDYGFPVYAIAVRRGCNDADQGETRRTCGDRLIARMIRSPFEGKPPRARSRGQRLFAAIEKSRPQSDDALISSLDKAGLEWREADIHACPTAKAYLATGGDLKFSPVLNDGFRSDEIVLHADTISFEVGDYLMRSRYAGWLKPGSPAAWAAGFAESLESCWKPSTSPVPWRVVKK